MSRLVLQVSHNQEVGVVLTSSTALTFLCSPWRRNKSTSYWCVRKREKSSLYSRMAMWWTWTQNLVSPNQTRASFALWSGWMQTEHFTHWNKRWRCTFIFRHPFLNVEKKYPFFRGLNIVSHSLSSSFVKLWSSCSRLVATLRELYALKLKRCLQRATPGDRQPRIIGFAGWWCPCN